MGFLCLLFFPASFLIVAFSKSCLPYDHLVGDEGTCCCTFLCFLACVYSKISMTRTPMTRLPWLIRNRFESLDNSSDSSIKDI